MDEARYCPRCATPLAPRPDGERLRPTCPACGYVHYVNPVVAAGTLVERDGRLLLVRRGVPPGEGRWGLPAGYAEADETPEQAAVRETREESGLEVTITELLSVLPFGGQGLPSGVLILYGATAPTGEPRPGDDALEARFFAPDELPGEIAFRTHRQAVEHWRRSHAVRVGPAPDRQSAEAFLRAHGQRPAPEEALLVALDGPQVVGVLRAVVEAGPPRWRVLDVLVAAGYRRWGIGTRLVKAAAAAARQAGAEELWAEVAADHPALALFLRAGLAPCGYRQRPEGGQLLLSQPLG